MQLAVPFDQHGWLLVGRSSPFKLIRGELLRKTGISGVLRIGQLPCEIL